jgi:hypothetical protein
MEADKVPGVTVHVAPLVAVCATSFEQADLLFG